MAAVPTESPRWALFYQHPVDCTISLPGVFVNTWQQQRAGHGTQHPKAPRARRYGPRYEAEESAATAKSLAQGHTTETGDKGTPRPWSLPWSHHPGAFLFQQNSRTRGLGGRRALTRGGESRGGCPFHVTCLYLHVQGHVCVCVRVHVKIPCT